MESNQFVVSAYVSECRKRIPHFVESHFTLEQTWKLQWPTFWWDLLVGPLNSAWALPYLSIKKAIGICEGLGYSAFAQSLSFIPSGLKTGYQRKVEKLIREELLQWEKNRALVDFPEARFRAILKQFCEARALVSDLAGTAITFLYGWFFFGNHNLGLDGIARRFAQREAYQRKASHFFLGKKIGYKFYEIFPPETSPEKVRHYYILLIVGLTVGAMICTILSDPLRRFLGLQHRKLSALVDELEKEMVYLSHKRSECTLTILPTPS